MADPILGKNVVLSMLVGDTYYPILCATDCTYNCNAEFIEKTGPNSGGARQWMRRLEEHVSSVTGLSRVNNEASLSFFYMLQVGIRREEQTFKMDFDDGDNQISIAGVGLIGNQGINGPASDFSNASIEIKWNGEPSTDVISSPSAKQIQDTLYIPVVDGAFSVHHALLEAAGVEILEAGLEGIEYDETTGTPGNREFKFGGVGVGTIIFRDALIGGQTVYVLYAL